MKRVYAEVTVKVRLYYKDAKSLVEAVEGIQDDFGFGLSRSTGGYSWESIKAKPVVKVLE